LQGGDKMSVHSLVFAANSKYLKPWMETTFVPDLNVSYNASVVKIYNTASSLCVFNTRPFSSVFY
jgi:hypothetical protein